MSDGSADPTFSITGVLPEPLPDAPYTSRSLAHLELAQALRSVVEYACALVPAGPRPGPVYDGALLADALALQEMTTRVVVAAVLAERDDGTTWAQLGRAADLDEAAARSRWYGEEWSRRADIEGGHAGARPGDTAAVDAAANELDRWLSRHADPSAPDLGPAPVTSTLERMDPLRELLHWGTRRRDLAAAGPGAAGELVEVDERMELVYDALTEDPEHGDPDHRERTDALRRADAEHCVRRTGADQDGDGDQSEQRRGSRLDRP